MGRGRGRGRKMRRCTRRKVALIETGGEKKILDVYGLGELGDACAIMRDIGNFHFRVGVERKGGCGWWMDITWWMYPFLFWVFHLLWWNGEFVSSFVALSYIALTLEFLRGGG